MVEDAPVQPVIRLEEELLESGRSGQALLRRRDRAHQQAISLGLSLDACESHRLVGSEWRAKTGHSGIMKSWGLETCTSRGVNQPKRRESTTSRPKPKAESVEFLAADRK